MKWVRWYFGGLLVIVARILIWAGQTLYRVGLAILPDRGTKTPQRVSPSRLGVLVPYTVETRDGRRITLYGIRKK